MPPEGIQLGVRRSKRFKFNNENEGGHSKGNHYLGPTSRDFRAKTAARKSRSLGHIRLNVEALKALEAQQKK